MGNPWEHPSVQAGIETQAKALARRLDDGASLIGWKVGVGALAAMRTAGISAPLVGFLTSATVFPDGAPVAVGAWTRPVLEPEIAIHVGTDVAPGATLAQGQDAISAVAPAIELADVDVGLDALESVVAGNIFHRAVILGDPDAQRRGGDVGELRVRVESGGHQIAATNDVTAATGPPEVLVVHVANWLGATGRRLMAGHVIIGGSVVPAIPVKPGDGVTYRCSPLGTLRVTFTDA